MKKVLLIALVSLMSFTAQAQSQVEGKRVVYIELLGTQGLMSTKIKVSVDLGQSKWDTNFKLRDENDKPIKFNSMVDVLNYMTKKGWEYVNSFPITHGSTNVYHYLMKKYVSNDDEIKEGLNLEKDE